MEPDDSKLFDDFALQEFEDAAAAVTAEMGIGRGFQLLLSGNWQSREQKKFHLAGLAALVKLKATPGSKAATVAEKLSRLDVDVSRQELLAKADAQPKEEAFKTMCNWAASCAQDPDHFKTRIYLEKNPSLSRLFENHFPRLLANEFKGHPTPVEVLEACGVQIFDLAEAFASEPDQAGDMDRVAFVCVVSTQAWELWLSVECPEAITLGDVRAFQKSRRPDNDPSQELSYDQSYTLAAMCSSPGKEGRVLRKHGLTTGNVMEVIKRVKAGAE